MGESRCSIVSREGVEDDRLPCNLLGIVCIDVIMAMRGNETLLPGT